MSLQIPMCAIVARALSLFLSCLLLGATQSAAAQTTPPLWVGFQVKGDVAYLLRKSPSEIARYDLASTQWLPPLALQEIPSAFVVGDTHIYIAYDRKIERMDLQGGNTSQVANTPNSVIGLYIDGNVLIANRSNYLDSLFSSYSVLNNALIDTHEDYPHSMFGASHSSVANRIYGRTSGISPSDIDALAYDAAGNFLEQRDSPYHGDYPSATQVWSWPDGSKAVDSSGTVYLGDDLSYAGSLSSAAVDVAFHGIDVPIVLTTSELIAYSQSLVETGRAALSVTGRNIAVRGGTIHVFHEDPASATRLGVQQVPLANLSPAQPGAPVSPVGLPYTVTSSAIDTTGVIYVLSKVHSSIFRWDVVTQKYLPSIPLAQTGDLLTYSPTYNALFVLGTNRTIYKINLAQQPLAANAFVTVPPSANFVMPIGADLLVAGNGGWDDQWVYSGTGTLLNSNFLCCYYTFHFYDAPRSRLFLDGTSISYLGNGQFSTATHGPYISGYAPVRLSADGQRIASKDGVIYQASPLQAIDYLSNDIVDAQWLGGTQLFTIKAPNPGAEGWSRLQSWSPYLTIQNEQALLGEHVVLHRTDEWLVEVTTSEGMPRFTVLDSGLSTVAPTSLDAPVIEIEDATALAVGLRWQDVQGETSYQIERRELDAGAWAEAGTAAQDAVHYLDVAHHGGKRMEYRVRARNGTLLSPWSNVVDVDLSSAAAPEPVDPIAVQFTIDEAVMGQGDRVYILSKEHKSVFVWNVHRQRFEPSITLRDTPLYMSYSSTLDAIFTGYAGGAIYSLSPRSDVPYEYPFATTEAELCGIVAADDIIVACDYSGAWEATMTYDVLGRRLDYKDWRYPIANGTWSPAAQRIYHFRDGSSPNDLIYTPISASGQVGDDQDSPYHTSTGITYPIRVRPDAGRVLLGSGYLFDAANLQHLGTLASPFTDATWINGELLTVQGETVSMHASELAAPEGAITLSGAGRRLLRASGSRLVVAFDRDNTTVLEVYDAEYQRVEPPIHSDGFE